MNTLLKTPWYFTGLIALGAYFAPRFVNLQTDFGGDIIDVLFRLIFVVFGVTTVGKVLPLLYRKMTTKGKRKRIYKKQNSLQSVQNLSWQEFEQLITAAFEAKGFSVVEDYKGGADGGVDVRLKKDGKLFLIQCKHWKSQVGVKVVRELYGVMQLEGAASGAVVCTRGFTKEAYKFAQESGVKLMGAKSLHKLIPQLA